VYVVIINRAREKRAHFNVVIINRAREKRAHFIVYLVSFHPKTHKFPPLVEDPELVAGTGEGEGGGEKIICIQLFTNSPSPLSPPARGGEGYFRMDTS
jgi:hypothetical protein